ncbi:hypothetical protein WDZ92_18875 [Nostoc sp. NIES-2111]
MESREGRHLGAVLCRNVARHSIRDDLSQGGSKERIYLFVAIVQVDDSWFRLVVVGRWQSVNQAGFEQHLHIQEQ